MTPPTCAACGQPVDVHRFATRTETMTEGRIRPDGTVESRTYTADLDFHPECLDGEGA